MNAMTRPTLRGSQAFGAFRVQRRVVLPLCSARALDADGPDRPAWLSAINRKTGHKMPDWQAGMPSTSPGEGIAQSLGSLNKDERSRVMDAMRADARVQEASTSQVSELLDSGTGGGDPGGRGKNSGVGPDGEEWYEDDPYGSLRPDGAHSMRGWTFCFAAVMAGGGLLACVSTGLLGYLQLGWTAAALLVLSGGAMSDMESVWGALGVKVAWAVCALLVLWEATRPRHVRRQQLSSDACGLAALLMCLGYMLTDMSALGEVALPTNPGAVFKSPDIAYRSRVWQEWGYGQVQMRV